MLSKDCTTLDRQHHPTPVSSHAGPKKTNKPIRKTSYYSSFNNTTTMKKSNSQYLNDVLYNSSSPDTNEAFWKSLIGTAAYYRGSDPLFGEVLTMIYENPSTSKLCSLTISKHGQTIVDSMSLHKDSKYYPAINNLSKNLKDSNVRKALAVSNLRTFASLDSTTKQLLYQNSRLSKTFDWDETIAGELASRMHLIDSQKPEQIGDYLLSLGYTQPHKTINSYVADVIYSNDQDDERIADANNELAFLLGEQMDNLFDPLTEYSPEPTEKAYRPPSEPSDYQSIDDDILVKSVCNELVKVQTNFTVLLVQFLQKFLIPLRVQVLEGKIKNLTTARLNQIFPPTIDEVTRINCIFLDMLQLASPYGSFELLKACGTTIPYFYKAQMRHEAATKNFQSNFEGFLMDLKQSGFDNDMVYDKRTIESIIHSSLNLPKLQMVLNRLMETKKWPEHMKVPVEEYYQSCVKTVMAFGTDKLKPYNHRIFTPTGKILTELASDWPAELQYGWLTRRVVAIFDVQDMLSESIKNNGAIIIFSDHVLFLDIVDDHYYANLLNDKEKAGEIIHKPSIADILMHSLVNEVPFSNLPMMKVSKWSSIDKITAQHYNHSDSSYVQFLDDTSIGVYKIDKFSGHYVIEILNKAKILNKSQPFHLFRSSSSAASVYYTAHELSSYKMEDVRSSFAIFLNMPFDIELLNLYNLFGMITVSLADDDNRNVKVEGISRNIEKIHYVIPKDSLTVSLLSQIIEMMSDCFTYANPQLNTLLMSRAQELLDRALKVLNFTESKKAKELESIKKRIKSATNEQKAKEDLVIAKSTSRGSSLDLLTENGNNRVSSTKITRANDHGTPRQANELTTSGATTKKAKPKSKQRFFSRLFTSEHKRQTKTRKAAASTSNSKSASKKRLSQLFLSGEHPIQKPVIDVERPVSRYSLTKEQDEKPTKPSEYALTPEFQVLSVNLSEAAKLQSRSSTMADITNTSHFTDATKTTEVSNSSSSIFVNQSFAFPNTSAAQYKVSAIEQGSSPSKDISVNNNDTRSGVKDAGFGEIADCKSSEVESIVHPEAEISSEMLYQELDPSPVPAPAPLKRTRNPLLPLPEHEIPSAHEQTRIKSQSAVECYVQQLRQARAIHERQLKKNGISSVNELPVGPLDYRGLMYSPSTVSRLNNLNKQMISKGISEDEEEEKENNNSTGNWVKFTSRENSLKAGLSSLQTNLPRLPPLHETINSKTAKQHPASSYRSLTLPEATSLPENITKNGKEESCNLNDIPALKEALYTSEVDSPISTQSNEEFFTPMMFPGEKFQSAPQDLRSSSNETLDILADINITDDSFTVTLPGLQKDSNLTPSLKSSCESRSKNELSDRANEASNLFAANRYPSSTFSLKPPVAVFPINTSLENPALSSINFGDDEDDYSGFDLDTTTNLTERNMGDQTSLCSALNDLRDTTAGEALLNVMSGRQNNSKRLFSNSTVSSFGASGLVNDTSYAYLAGFLDGDITIGAIREHEPVVKRNEEIDYDALYARGIKDSSVGYLAGFIGSGRTEYDLHALTKEEQNRAGRES
ncbi:hypothetical protein CANARDRAFT_29230 [[Candida] arabinofermentans NRRL YB-2248]|uniref:Uncharacterized protein n=1 Tax=[Candida] arabinofermentans NRRL YB-2248 TaxID=983967 RepID=A0A1E4SY00_9ASCO|nr:hypothetical protein CANARDRAFT_29230 [[Candida] arabinofermentans NRRL YB-2248]